MSVTSSVVSSLPVKRLYLRYSSKYFPMMLSLVFLCLQSLQVIRSASDAVRVMWSQLSQTIAHRNEIVYSVPSCVIVVVGSSMTTLTKNVVSIKAVEINHHVQQEHNEY